MEHYVHGAANALTNAIIECEMTSSSAPPSKRQEIIDDGDDEDDDDATPGISFNASCSLIETDTSGNVYINSFHKLNRTCPRTNSYKYRK